MSLIGDTIERLLQPFFDKLKSVFAPLGRTFNLFGRLWTNVTTIGTRGRALIDEIIGEVNAWKNFRENIAFRTKLVSLPAAIDHAQSFIDEIRTAWAAILDLIQQIKNKFNIENPTQEAEEAIADIENSGLRGIVEKFPKLFKGLEKVLGAVALLVDTLESISATIDDLTAIVNVLRDLREDVETGGPLFLSQSNRRRRVHLEDGTALNLRVGNLHQ